MLVPLVRGSLTRKSELQRCGALLHPLTLSQDLLPANHQDQRESGKFFQALGDLDVQYGKFYTVLCEWLSRGGLAEGQCLLKA